MRGTAPLAQQSFGMGYVTNSHGPELLIVCLFTVARFDPLGD